MADAYGGAAPAAAPPSPVVEPVSGRLPALPEPCAAVVQALFRRPRRWTSDDGAVLVLEPGGPPLPAEAFAIDSDRSEEHTSELQSRENLVCRLLLEKKKKT